MVGARVGFEPVDWLAFLVEPSYVRRAAEDRPLTIERFDLPALVRAEAPLRRAPGSGWASRWWLTPMPADVRLLSGATGEPQRRLLGRRFLGEGPRVPAAVSAVGIGHCGRHDLGRDQRPGSPRPTMSPESERTVRSWRSISPEPK